MICCPLVVDEEKIRDVETEETLAEFKAKFVLKALKGFVTQLACRDSLCESSVIAECYEQLGPYEVQDQEVVVL